ncbi:MAG TPA: hypothetical protein VHD55_00575 [Candidatus Paceibacterota bacterium]|nr:hypothetical protein [Candidatus Paceibacterota bacterium]
MLIKKLAEYCEIEPDDRAEEAYILHFPFPNAVRAHIRIVFNDRQTGADLVITNMTVIPHTAYGRGFGSQALAVLLEQAWEAGLRDIRAVQVQRQSERFWEKNRFSRVGNVTNDFLYHHA